MQTVHIRGHRCFITPCSSSCDVPVRFILFHGFAGNHTLWSPLVESLSEAAEVITLDLFNHFHDVPRNCSLRREAFGAYHSSLIADVMRHFSSDAKQVVPVFWSLSSLLFFELATGGSAFENLSVKQVFLLAGTASFTDIKGRSGVYPSALKKQVRALRGSPQQELLRLVGTFGRKQPGWLTGYRFPLRPELLQEQLTYLLQADFKEIISSCPLPVSLIHGDEDNIIPLEMAYFLKESLPSATLTVIRGGTHALMWDNPKELAEIMLNQHYFPTSR